MNARRYQPTLNRHQDMILPMRVEDYVSPTNTVRAIDAYVGTLDQPFQGDFSAKIYAF